MERHGFTIGDTIDVTTLDPATAIAILGAPLYAELLRLKQKPPESYHTTTVIAVTDATISLAQTPPQRAERAPKRRKRR